MCEFATTVPNFKHRSGLGNILILLRNYSSYLFSSCTSILTTSLGKSFYFSGNQSGRHARHEKAGSVHHRKAILPVTKVAERNMMSEGVIGIWGDWERRKRKRIIHCRKRRLHLGTLHYTPPDPDSNASTSVVTYEMGNKGLIQILMKLRVRMASPTLSSCLWFELFEIFILGDSDLPHAHQNSYKIHRVRVYPLTFPGLVPRANSWPKS